VSNDKLTLNYKTMTKTTFLFLLAVLLFSCTENDPLSSKENEPTQTLTLEGIYKGQFMRVNPNAGFQTAEVTLTLDESGYTGASSINMYPALCKGSYEQNDKKINFKNACAWIAAFDWTLVLDGEYQIEINKDQVILKRYYANGFTDHYTLTKQP
jgi:hypothetical protein